MAQWTTAYINELPDECFAYIEPGGSKDGNGRTVPLDLRHLPFRGMDGKIDIAHLRNALARLPQTDIPLEGKREAFKRLAAAAKEAGVEVDAERFKKQHNLAEQGLLKIPFFRLGAWRHPLYGKIKADQRFLADMVKNFKGGVLGRPVFVRLGHDSGDKGTFGDAPAEAWVKDVAESDGVLHAIAEPTSPETADLVRSGRYRFASAEYWPDYVDKETGAHKGPVLTSIALTNEPFLTKLPEAVVLAETPGTIYLDYEEVREGMDDVLKKLSEAVTKFFEGLKPAPGAGGSGLTDEERKKLTEIDGLRAELADAKTKLVSTEARLSTAENNSWVNQVERRLADLVAKGIPPVMCDQAKAILLAMPAAATTMVKLADNKEISLADQIFAGLEALPEAHRVKMPQIGSQESIKPGSPEEIKKLADEDVKALGGKVTEDGKYVL